MLGIESVDEQSGYSLRSERRRARGDRDRRRARVWEAHKVDSRGIFAMGASPDVKEGIAAFMEKRAPDFRMKPSSDMPAFYPGWEDRPFK